MDSAGATLNLTGAGFLWEGGTLTLEGEGTLTNDGLLVGFRSYAYADVLLGGSGQMLNRGTIDWRKGVWSSANGATSSLVNAAEGTMRKTTTDNVRLNLPITNSGTVDIQAGSLTLDDTYIQVDGITAMTGGSLSASKPLVLGGGGLTGSGTIAGNVENRGARIEPGLPIGQLSINGDYTQGSDSRLVIDLGGVTPVAKYDRLTITGTARLDGSLQVRAVNGFVPSLGQSFLVLRAGAVAGEFSKIKPMGFPRGLGLKATYGGTGVTLTVVRVPQRIGPA